MFMQETFNPRRSLGSIMGRVGKAMERALTERFRQADLALSVDHFIVLMHLGEEDGQSQLQLGAEAGRNKTTVTRAIDRLEKENMVVRVPDRQDRRHKRVYLTQKGKEMVTHMQQLAMRQMEEAKEGINPDELIVAKKVLLQVYENLKHYI